MLQPVLFTDEVPHRCHSVYLHSLYHSSPKAASASRPGVGFGGTPLLGLGACSPGRLYARVTVLHGVVLLVGKIPAQRLVEARGAQVSGKELERGLAREVYEMGRTAAVGGAKAEDRRAGARHLR